VTGFFLHEDDMTMKIGAFATTSTVALILMACGDAPPSAKPKDPFVTVQATVETQPMQDAEDAADDPAIWIDPANPANSVIIGTNKQRGLAVYGLDGKLLSFRDDGRMNNVDIRQNVILGTATLDIVAATNRTNQTIALYTVDTAQRVLTPLASIATGFADPYGVCMYRNKVGELFVIANDSDSGNYAQWRITSTDGATIQSEQVRKFTAGSQAEGCVADDANGTLFVSEEDVGLWAYSAEPTGGDMRTSVDTVASGHLTADAEGVALVEEASGAGYIILSSQGSNSYNLYDRVAPHAFRGTFVVGDGVIDGIAETDGLDVSAANLGPAFPGGVFIAQDGFNIDGADQRKANQNFKLVPWPAIRDALKLPAPQETAPQEAAPAP